MASSSALLSELIARLGNRTDIQARALVWLNDAYFELLLSPRFDFYELDTTADYTLTAGTTAVPVTDIAADVWAIRHIQDVTNERRLVREDVRDLDDFLRVGGTASTGTPERYAHYGVQILFAPKPDQNYPLRLRYRKRPAELDGTNPPVLGREWDEVLTALAVCKGWEALEQWDKASAQRQMVEGLFTVREEPMRLEDADAETTIGVALEGI